MVHCISTVCRPGAAANVNDSLRSPRLSYWSILTQILNYESKLLVKTLNFELSSGQILMTILHKTRGSAQLQPDLISS